MERRIVAIWFPDLITDRLLRQKPELKNLPFGLAATERGRRVLKAVNHIAQEKGVYKEMVVADSRAILPELQIFEYENEQSQKLLFALAEWFIRYTPLVSPDLPDGLILDVSGCTHLWGSEEKYLGDIHKRMSGFGYTIQTAMADTIGAAWAFSRFGAHGNTSQGIIIKTGNQAEAISSLPAAAIRPEDKALERLEKLGLKTIGSFIKMPRTALRRRFGQGLLTRIGQALGEELEFMEPVRPVPPYQERLPSMEPIWTRGGIDIALERLLESLCLRLGRESKGLRKCEFHCFRVDGITQKIETGTSRPSRNRIHLLKLFELEIGKINPGPGIELFVLEATVVEELPGTQDSLWTISANNEEAIAELIDRMTGKIGAGAIHRYLPAEHYWPERSVREADSLSEKSDVSWRTDLPRPLHLLPKPERIEVSVPIPDYPPMLFRYKGEVHAVKKADGPERIEQEWWVPVKNDKPGGPESLYRDYYCVEDEQGARYWLFRSGDYASGQPQWFIHGFFA